MRLWAAALLLAPLRAVAQDPAPDAVVAAMQARAPRFRDLELRYLGRLSVPGDAELGGETRLVLVPGAGLRTDCAMWSLGGSGPELQELEVEASAAELADDLYFWGTAHRGPKELFAILPPCLSLKGSRKDHGATLDAFPADFPFRWACEDWFALYALAPREAFARDPGLKSSGRKVVDGRDCHVLEVAVPGEKAPAGSLLRAFPIGLPAKRFFVEAETDRLFRIELEFTADRSLFIARWQARSWKEVSGISVPAEVDLAMGPQRQGQARDETVTIRKVLSSLSVDKGLTARDLLPEERRKDIHVDSVVRPVDFYSAAIERDPKSAAAWAGRAVARYREAVARALQEKGGEPRVDPAEPIADLEKAQAIAPSSPYVILSLMRSYEVAGREKDLSALAQAVEGQPIGGADVRLALARHWVKAGDGERALKALEGVEAPAGSPLGLRLARGRLRASALGLRGKAAEAGRALLDLAGGAGPGETDLIVDVLSPPPAPPRRRKMAGPAPEEDKGLRAAIDAALEADPRSAPLQEMRLNSAARAGEKDRMRTALEEYAGAVDSPAALDRAARLALDLFGKDEGSPEALAACEAAAERIAKKAPDSTNGALLLGLALLKGRKAEAALPRLESVLGGLEKGEVAAEDAERQAGHVAVLSRAFSEAGREEAVLRACRLFIRCVNRTPRPWMLLRGDGTDPITTCVSALLAKSRHMEAFNILKELEFQKFDYLYNLRQVMRPSEEAFLKAVRDEVEKSKDPEDHRKLARLIQRTTSRPHEAMPVLERARELAPGNVEVLEELARLCMGYGGDRERAIQVYEELVGAIEKAPGSKVDRDHSLFMVANLQHMLGRPEKAVAALDRVNLEAPSVAGSLLTAATIYELAGKPEKAAAAYRRFIEKFKDQPYMVASGTYGRLGLLCEKMGKEDEAYVCYARGIEVLRKEREQGRVPAQPMPGRPRPQESTDPSVRREALLARLGRDYFIERFLRQSFEPLAPAEEKRAKELYEKLRSDSIVEREEAGAELRKIGPRAAPLIKGGLDSGDPEFKARVRQILADWSEPR